MKRYLFLASTVVLIVVAAIAYSSATRARSLGNTMSGLKPAPGLPITPEQAVALSQPYLDNSFDLRSRYLMPERRKPDKPATDWVTLKGDTYYVARDNYPVITSNFYIPYAVTVHAQMGGVTSPTASST